MNYWQRWIGAVLKQTGDLSCTEMGVFDRLMDHYYAKEEPLPGDIDKCCRIVRAMTKHERDAVESVLKQFFVLDGDVYRNDRCDQELTAAQPKLDAARTNGARGGRPKKNPDPNPPTTHKKPNGFAPGTHDEPRAKPLQSPDSSLRSEEARSYDLARARRPDDPPRLTLVGEPPEPKTAANSSMPDCPHGEVLALWAEVLPSMPQHTPSMWRGAREVHLRARWREAAASEHWASKADGMAYFRRLFGYVGQSSFLTGRAKQHGDRRPFVIELEWLVKPANWAKVVEGKYHGVAA